MADYIEVRTMEEVAYLLNVLFTNMNNLDRVYYDMFVNPEPMDITLERYDETGTITTVVLPNRAKDRVLTYSGTVDPNGNQVATVGAIYINTTSKVLFYKAVGSDAYGWLAIWSASNMVEGITFLRPDGNGSRLSDLNANSITEGKLSVSYGGTGSTSLNGVIKGNGTEPFTEAVDGVDFLGPSCTGLIAYFPISTIPAGWLYCDGAAYSRTTYSRLFNVIGTLYGAGDGVTTFNVPDLRDYFVKGWDGYREFNVEERGHVGLHSHELSGSTGAGSPHSHTRGSMNITGSLTDASQPQVMQAEGCFYVSQTSGSRYNIETTGNLGTLNFDASRSWTGSTSEESLHTHTLEGSYTKNAGSGENTVTNKSLVPIIKY